MEVRGDQLPITDPYIGGTTLCTFRTDVPAATEQSWWMYRDILQIGRIWNESGHRAFHLQSMLGKDNGQDRYSGLMLQNSTGDGLWVMNDGTPTGSRAFPNALQLLDAEGYAALGPQASWLFPGTFNPRGPWSRFHLFHDVVGTRPQFAFRPQMKNGVSFTGNSDHAYIGQWFDQGEDGTGAEVDDNSNLVLAIGEDAIPDGLTHKWDNISFRLFSDMDAPMGASGNVEGQELVRIQPVRPTSGDDPEAHMGIGDFLTAGDVPSEALDLLTGKVRIRQLPGDAPSASTELVTVNMTTGVLEHIPGGSLPDNCEWAFDAPGSYNVVTASGTGPGCAGDNNSVWIGGTAGGSKLFVQSKLAAVNPIAIQALSLGNAITTGNLTGILGSAHDNGGYSGSYHYGVMGRAINASAANIGLHGDAQGGANCYGIIASASGGSGTNHAGYFSGTVVSTGGFIPSDEQLKTNVQELDGALATVMQIGPKTYSYKAGDYPSMHLPTVPQAGVLAQELEEVLPGLVTAAVQPAEFDAQGVETTAAVGYKAVNMAGLIPYLIGAIQEQQARIDALTVQMENCCAAERSGNTRSMPQGGDTGTTDLLTIAPNPFIDATTVTYTLKAAGRMRLEVGTQDGRRLEVLREERTKAGTFQYEWSTGGLPPGTYLVSLLLDDQVMTKKAVKVGH